MKRNRVPIKFFVSKGSGVSNITQHAGSYHLALWDAGIDGYNFVPYSSVLHRRSERLYELEEIEKLLPEHGSEMMCIQAVANGTSGETISAGIIYTYLTDKTGKVYGGIVCEESGKYSREEMQKRLYEVLRDMFERTYGSNGLMMLKAKCIVETQTIPEDMKYGTSIVSINFLTYR